MELTVLGSGTGIPTLARGSPGYALRLGSGYALFDTGSGTLKRLAEAGIDFWRVEHVFYSHFHPDHTGDLVPLLFGKRNPQLRGSSPLTVHGPPGIKELVAKLSGVYGRWIDGSGYGLTVEEIGPAGITVGGAIVTAHSVVHTDASVAYRVESDGRIFAYSGDSDVCPGLVEAARDADLFVVECSSPDAQKLEGHLTPRLCGELAAQARAKRVLLSHLYPVMETIDPVPPCERAFLAGSAGWSEKARRQRAVIVAQDLMRLGV